MFTVIFLNQWSFESTEDQSILFSFMKKQNINLSSQILLREAALWGELSDCSHQSNAGQQINIHAIRKQCKII